MCEFLIADIVTAGPEYSNAAFLLGWGVMLAGAFGMWVAWRLTANE